MRIADVCAYDQHAATCKGLQGGFSEAGGSLKVHQSHTSANFKLVGWQLACLSAGVIVLMTVTALAIAGWPVSWAGHVQPRYPGAAGGTYLRQIAAVHDLHRHAPTLLQQQQVMVYLDLQASLQQCARQLVTPKVQLPQHIPRPRWHPPSSRSRALDPLAPLDLDCSNPDHAAACADAASSNVYEDAHLMTLDPVDLKSLLQGSAGDASTAAAVGTSQPDLLADLTLNCDQDPSACQHVTAATNSYESERQDIHGTSGAELSAVALAAEAAAFFISSSAAAAKSSELGWEVLLGASALVPGMDSNDHHHQQQQQEHYLQMTNMYEVTASAHQRAPTWQNKRHAEETAAQYLDVSALNLDCSPAAQQADPSSFEECRRSRAVNKYEGRAHAPAAATATADDESWAEHSVDVSRVAGRQQAAAAAAAAEASRASATAEARRTYFKNACNSPAARGQYKNRNNQPMCRLHYKNPANIPATLALLLTPPTHTQAAPASPPALPGASEATTYPSYRLAATTAVMGLLVAAAVAVLCSGQHLLTFSGQAWLPLLRLGPAADAEHPQPPGGPLELVRPTCKMSRSWSCLLVPWHSQELPAPQLSEVEVPLHAPLPALGSLAGSSLGAQWPAAAPPSPPAPPAGSFYGIQHTANHTADGNTLPPRQMQPALDTPFASPAALPAAVAGDDSTPSSPQSVEGQAAVHAYVHGSGGDAEAADVPLEMLTEEVPAMITGFPAWRLAGNMLIDSPVMLRPLVLEQPDVQQAGVDSPGAVLRAVAGLFGSRPGTPQLRTSSRPVTPLVQSMCPKDG